MKLPALAVSSLLLLATLGAAPALGSSSTPTPLPLLSPTTPQGMEGGFWRTDGNFDPILHLKNVLLKQPLDVTPSLIFADGTSYVLPIVHLEPAGVASVNIGIAIQGVPQSILPHVSQFGMAAISYQWSWSAVIASIQDTDEIASLSNVSSTLATTAVVHKTPEDATQRTLRGTWWKPTKGSDYVLQVGNTSLTAKLAQVRVSDHLGNLMVQTSVPLASHCSALLRLSTLLAGQSATENTGDISIVYTGPKNGVVASASIEDEAIGYSVTPHLAEQIANDSESSQSVTLDAPGIMVGAADPAMFFPVDTVFMPYSVLHNVSTHPLTAQVSFTSDGADGQPATRTLGQFPLAAGQSQMLDLSQYFTTVNPLPNGYGHLSIAYQGQYEDMIFDAGSADQSGTYVFQVMPSGEASTTSKIFCYWTIDGDNSSMISVWNYSQTPQDATLTLYYFGGQYRIPIHLDARKSYNLDVMELVKSQVPDADGNLIPSNIKSGSAMLVGPSGSELERMNVVVSASAYNVRNATCYPICTNCGGLTSLYLSPSTTSTVINDNAQVTAMETTSSGGPYPATGATWSTGSASIATVNNGDVDGKGAGSTSISATMSAPSGQYQCYESSVCADQQFGGYGTVDVEGDQTPVINSITPDTWPAGTTTPVTFTGQYFGTNQPSLTFYPVSGPPVSGIIVQSYSNVGDTGFVANITVVPNNPTEAVAVSVTNNGYGAGNSFYGGGGGGVDTSSPAGAAVSGVPNVTPTITMNGTQLTSLTSVPVVVGQQIVLTATLPTAQAQLLSSQGWGAPTGGTAIAGYVNAAGTGPADTTGSQVVPVAATTTATTTFYWVYPVTGSTPSVTFTYQLSNGNAPSTTAVTFAVSGVSSPSISFVNYVLATIDSLTGCPTGGGPYLAYGNVTGPAPNCSGTISGSPGIQFSPVGSPPGAGNFLFAQIVNSDAVNYSGPSSSCSTVSGIDGQYPYQGMVNPATVVDGPLQQAYATSLTRNFQATMYLLWQPTTTGAIPVPLGYIPWEFVATATNTAGTWSASGAGGPTTPYPSFVTSNASLPHYGYPIWTGKAIPTCSDQSE